MTIGHVYLINQVHVTDHDGRPNGLPIISHVFVNQVHVTNHHGSPNGPIISHVYLLIKYRPIIMVDLTVL